MNKDYYAVLGVSKTASQEEIKKAYRKLAHEHHPDKGGSEAKFKEINEAFQAVGDPEKRAKYDQFGSNFEQAGGFGGGGNPFEGFGNMNFNGADFGDLFSNFGFGGGESQRARGQDVAVDVGMTLEEAAFGVTREFSLHMPAVCESCTGTGGEKGSELKTCDTCKGRGQVTRVQRTILGAMQTVATCSVCEGRGKIPEKKCHTCHGAGVYKQTVKLSVKIPAGIDDGAQIRIRGKGAAAPHGGEAGDLYVRVALEPHKTFTREGFDIHSKVFLPFSLMTLGGTHNVATIDGTVTMKIPEHTASGQIIRLKERGITRMNSSMRGDHFVEVQALIPTKLSKDQRKVVEQLRALGM